MRQLKVTKNLKEDEIFQQNADTGTLQGQGYMQLFHII